jgi:hypothetical protein
VQSEFARFVITNLNNISYWSDPVDDPIANAACGFNFRIFTGFTTVENQLLNTTAELAT